MKSVNLEAIFGAAEKVFSAKLEALRASVHHAGLKGAAVENLVSEFFRDILPKNIGVGTGVIIDSAGSVSKQIDIILYDAAATPGFLAYGEVAIFPIECVYFVIEVKTSLGPSEFDRCVQNMTSVKSLRADAYTFKTGPIIETKFLYGEELRTWWPPYLIFALESNNFEGVAERFRRHRSSRLPTKDQVDALYVLGSGTIANIDLPSSDISLLPTPNSFLAIPEDPGIFIFIALFSVYFNQASLGATFNFLRYVDANIGRTRILADPADLDITLHH